MFGLPSTRCEPIIASGEQRNVTFLECNGDNPETTDWSLTMIWHSDHSHEAAFGFIEAAS